MVFFCDECGAANEPGVQCCVACQHPLGFVPPTPLEMLITPAVVTPPEVQEVVTGTLHSLASSGVPADCFPGMVLFGRYQIRREIGHGGFSIVYLAEDLQAKRRLVPPEQYGRAQTDARADIYGLGATLQTLLTGRDPLEWSRGGPSRNPGLLSPRIYQLFDEMLAPESDRRPSRMAHIERRLFRLMLSNARSRWHLFFSVCLGAGFGVLLYIGWSFSVQTFNALPNYLQPAIIVSLAILYAVRLSGRTFPGESSLKRLFWRAGRYVYGSFVRLGLACVLAIVCIGWIIQFLLFIIRGF